MNTATQIRKNLQSIALREVTHTIDTVEAHRMSRKLWERAYRLGVDQEVRNQLGLCARGKLV